jgi:hypothetical protein
VSVLRDPNAGPPDRPLRPGHQRLDLHATCGRCRLPIHGWIEFDTGLQVVDTEAFMLFNDGPVCDRCLVRGGAVN